MFKKRKPRRLYKLGGAFSYKVATDPRFSSGCEQRGFARLELVVGDFEVAHLHPVAEAVAQQGAQEFGAAPRRSGLRIGELQAVAQKLKPYQEPRRAHQLDERVELPDLLFAPFQHGVGPLDLARSLLFGTDRQAAVVLHVEQEHPVHAVGDGVVELPGGLDGFIRRCRSIEHRSAAVVVLGGHVQDVGGREVLPGVFGLAVVLVVTFTHQRQAQSVLVMAGRQVALTAGDAIRVATLGGELERTSPGLDCIGCSAELAQHDTLHLSCLRLVEGIFGGFGCLREAPERLVVIAGLHGCIGVGHRRVKRGRTGHGSSIRGR